jgi:hypothetical protein
MSFSNPRLYLSGGVTTMRTAGSVDAFTDLRIKELIEKGRLPRPPLDVTGPYLQGTTERGLPPECTSSPAPTTRGRRSAYWADRGVTSFKAYKNITRAELRAAVEEAHRRGLKVTGHLCSVTYEEAADDRDRRHRTRLLHEHRAGPTKKPDTCSDSQGDDTLEHTSPGSPEANRLIATLIGHHVAITSTMPGLAATLPPADGRPAVHTGSWKPCHPRCARAICTAAAARSTGRNRRPTPGSSSETWTCSVPLRRPAGCSSPARTPWV